MNSENRYPVTASLYMLREIKQRQEKVNRGYQLLKRKTEALRFRGRQATAELSTVQALLGHTLKEAYISLAAIKFTNGESNALVLENVGQAQIRVQRIPENISGVSTVSLQAVEDHTASDAFRYAGLGAGGHRTSETKRAFREVTRILIKFASLRNICVLLDEAIRTTLRKVNGIEKVILPKLRNTENYILTEMDERHFGIRNIIVGTTAQLQLRYFPLSTNHLDSQSYYTQYLIIFPLDNYFEEICLTEQQLTQGSLVLNIAQEREEYHRLKMVKAKKNLSRMPKPVKKVYGDSSDVAKTALEIKTVSLEAFTSAGGAGLSSTSVSAGDFKPVCYPHYWDDDDLLF